MFSCRKFRLVPITVFGDAMDLHSNRLVMSCACLVQRRRHYSQLTASKKPLGFVIRLAPPAPVFDDKTRLAELAVAAPRGQPSRQGVLILFST